MQIATIDIGTNTTRLAIIESNGFKIIEKYRTITRLGENFNGYLQVEAKKRVLNTLISYKKIINSRNIKVFRGVATSVVREAKNGKDFIAEIYKNTGLKIDIIDGDEEARLTYFGVLSALNKKIENFILLDIGGGSNEFTLVKKRKIEKSLSLKFGVVFLYEKFIKNDPPKLFELSKMEKEIEKNILIVKKEFNKFNNLNNLHFVGTAGTITTLAAIHLDLKEYLSSKINNHNIPKTFLNSLISIMIKITNAERKEKFNIEKGREDVIIPGLYIVKSSMKVFGFNEIISIDSSLLEGIAYEKLL